VPSVTSREIHLVARPDGPARADHFAVTKVEVPEPGDGEVLVRNTWLSVDPYMRGRMDDVPSYIDPFPLHAALEGGAVGEVVAGRAPGVPVGATVAHFLGWREYAIVDAAAATVVDTSLAPPQAYLGVLGTTGLSAFIAVTEKAPVRAGDVVYVSAAAGSVGSIAGQLARRFGAATVIGSTGGPAKAATLVAELGFDHAIDHRAGPLREALARVAPDGIDVYVDNVGGAHLEAAVDAMRPDGRIALVGAVGGYDSPAPGPRNLLTAAAREVTVRGLAIGRHLHRFPAWTALAAGMLADGTLRTRETVHDGIEAAPAAFLGVLSGANTGKMLVRLAQGQDVTL